MRIIENRRKTPGFRHGECQKELLDGDKNGMGKVAEWHLHENWNAKNSQKHHDALNATES